MNALRFLWRVITLAAGAFWIMIGIVGWRPFPQRLRDAFWAEVLKDEEGDDE